MLRRRSSRAQPLQMVGTAGGGVAAGLKDINNTGESNAALWVAMGRLLRPVFRLIGGKHKLWPPSRQSAPLLTLLWCILCTPLWFLLRERRNRDVEVVEARRREYALSSLENLIANERVRLEEVDKAEKKAEEKQKQKQEAGDAVVEDEPEESKDGDDAKIPPPAEKLFELLGRRLEW